MRAGASLPLPLLALEQHMLPGAKVWLPQASGTQPAHVPPTVWVPECAHIVAWSWDRKAVLTMITLWGKACWVQAVNPGPGRPSPSGLDTPPVLASTLASTWAGWEEADRESSREFHLEFRILKKGMLGKTLSELF